MKTYFANPIYDSVFKYLMEDERIARTLLSALLKKPVLKVEQRPHEYTNVVRKEISMFRIDFAATVQEDDGRSRLILIELQKTWVETETLRFRQYLGAQYSRKENIVEESSDKHALPMVAVYLLGHRVGDLEEPVVYVSRKYYDYYGRELTKGVPDAFAESLTHDSIIVQLPLLRGRINNRLDEVLSVFDQTKAVSQDRQVLEVDDSVYGGDAEMSYLLHRLTMAAADPLLRQDMNVEDEYFKAIEDRDTALMAREKRLAEQEVQLAEKDARLAEQDARLAERETQLAEQDARLAEQKTQLAEQSAIIRQMIRNMVAGGMSVEAVAQMVGKTPAEVRQLLDSAE